jgi:predicted kinase
VAFDCLEFDPALRWIDVADEAAFLVADLQASHADPHAQAFLGGYLDQGGDFQACRVLDLYKAHRSLVRAKVLTLNLAEVGPRDASLRLSYRRRYLSHLACARVALQRKRPQLILMAGVSGTGKTWLAERLAPSLGAVHVRSDIERKRLAGLGAQDRSHSALGEGIYDAPMNEAAYERLAECARAALEGGFTAIVDATFQRRSDRAQLCALAGKLGVSAHLILCHAPEATLERRIGERMRRSGEFSEADLSVMRAQLTRFEPIDTSERWSVIDASTETPGIAERIAHELKSSL